MMWAFDVLEHFSADAGWVSTRHVAAISERGLFDRCLDCHEERECADCHVALGEVEE